MISHFLDSTLADAITAGCDCVQVKHDGAAAQFAVAHGNVHVHTRFSASASESYHVIPDVDPKINCTLLGTHMQRTNRYVVFDCWLIENEDGNVIDLRREPYRSRYVAAKIQCKLLGPQFHLVVNHPITHAVALWRTLEYIPDAKGLLFRNSRDPAGVPLRVARWYREHEKKELV